jgi:lipopolysaccharide transport system permease protein
LTDRQSTTVSPSPPASIPRRLAGARAGHGAARRERLRQLVQLRDVTLHLVGRELAVRHRDSLFGWLWSLTPALLQLLVTHFLFTRVIPLGVENYAVFLLVGILAYNWFSRSLNSATTALTNSRNLVLRPGFPVVVLPVVAVLGGLVDYLLALPVLLAVVALTTGLRAELALFPLVLLVQLLLTLGLAWVVACANVFFRDMRHIVGLVVGLGFWITPIFYRQRDVPEAFSLVYDLNPMAYVIEAHRALLLGDALPSGSALVIATAASVGILLGGFLVFDALRHEVPDQL